MSEELKNLRKLIERQITFDNVEVNFTQDKRGAPKLSIKRLSLRNPILKSTMQSSIISNVSIQIPKQKKEELYSLWVRREENKRIRDEFEEKFREAVIETVYNSLKSKLSSLDLPTPIFPTSVARDETPNYYVSQPSEKYVPATKLELFNKLSNSICGRFGRNVYGLYVSEEGFETVRSLLRKYITPDFSNIDIFRLAEIKLNKVEPFEYLFYLLDKILSDMYRHNLIPEYSVELFVVEGVGGGKKFFSHYVIPNLTEIFYKLYYGKEKYDKFGSSKIKAMISSLLLENWKVDRTLKKKNLDIAHMHINRLLYYLFFHKKLYIDSILFLEDLKIKLGDVTPILFLEEVMSWI